MKDTRQIVLLISERSGSNLMRTLLGNHEEICAPPPPHLLMEFYPIRGYYGDLNKSVNSEKLLSDMVGLVNHPYHGWNINSQNVLNGATQVNSVVSAFDHLYKTKANEAGKIHYCSKGIHAFEFIDQYRAELKNVKFVHLVRDPRDHVASWLKRPIKKFTAYHIIQQWKKEQALFIDAATTRGLDFVSVRYEDLIQNTPKIMTQVLDYLAIERDVKCFQTNPNNVESKRNEYWENLSKPIIKDNSRKYRKQLTDKEILIVESITKNEMEYFNYEFETKADWAPTLLDTREISKERIEKKKEASIKPKADISLLEEKWKYVKKMKEKRKSELKTTNYELPKEGLALKTKLKKAVKTLLD